MKGVMNRKGVAHFVLIVLVGVVVLGGYAYSTSGGFSSGDTEFEGDGEFNSLAPPKVDYYHTCSDENKKPEAFRCSSDTVEIEGIFNEDDTCGDIVDSNVGLLEGCNCKFDGPDSCSSLGYDKVIRVRKNLWGEEVLYHGPPARSSCTGSEEVPIDPVRISFGSIDECKDKVADNCEGPCSDIHVDPIEFIICCLPEEKEPEDPQIPDNLDLEIG